MMMQWKATACLKSLHCISKQVEMMLTVMDASRRVLNLESFHAALKSTETNGAKKKQPKKRIN